MSDYGRKRIMMSEEDVRNLARQCVSDTLTSLGITHNEPHEMQKDFIHLRDLRCSTESMKGKAQMTLLGIFITSALAAMWLGVKEYFRS